MLFNPVYWLFDNYNILKNVQHCLILTLSSLLQLLMWPRSYEVVCTVSGNYNIKLSWLVVYAHRMKKTKAWEVLS